MLTSKRNFISAGAPIPLRVLFAVGSMEIGGAERRIVRYLRRLDRTRFSPGLYLIARRGPLLSELPDDVPVIAFSDRVPPAGIYWPGRVHRQEVIDLANALREFSADLLVTATFHQTLVAAGAILRRPTPLVAFEASDPRCDFERQVTRFRSIKRRRIASAYRRAAEVIALSQGARDGISDFYGVAPEQVTVFPNLIDIEEIDSLAAAAGPTLDPAGFHVVNVGRLSHEKGQSVLLAAAERLLVESRLPKLHVHLVGDGPMRTELERLAQEPRLAGRVHFAGNLRNPIAYLRSCQLFCLPSLQEGMPGALLEAMACGVPIVATDCRSGPREVLADGRFGKLVPVADPVALADAIEEVAGDIETARATAIAARQRVEQKYSLNSRINELEAILERAAADGDAGR